MARAGCNFLKTANTEGRGGDEGLGFDRADIQACNFGLLFRLIVRSCRPTSCGEVVANEFRQAHPLSERLARVG